MRRSDPARSKNSPDIRAPAEPIAPPAGCQRTEGAARRTPCGARRPPPLGARGAPGYPRAMSRLQATLRARLGPRVRVLLARRGEQTADHQSAVARLQDDAAALIGRVGAVDATLQRLRVLGALAHRPQRLRVRCRRLARRDGCSIRLGRLTRRLARRDGRGLLVPRCRRLCAPPTCRLSLALLRRGDARCLCFSTCCLRARD